MGYTRRWNTTDKKFTPDFINLNKAVIAIAHEKFGITICNELGTGDPVIDIDQICLNGNPAGATFYLLSGQASQNNACETDCKPYDLVVNALLLLAEEYGYVTDIKNEGPCFDDIAVKLITEAKKTIA